MGHRAGGAIFVDQSASFGGEHGNKIGGRGGQIQPLQGRIYMAIGCGGEVQLARTSRAVTVSS